DGIQQFIESMDSVYLGTASADGQPYIQHRGGPRGFLEVLDDRTIGFADFRGNRQYITTGNLSENRKAYLFLMDYAGRQRVKIWGEATVVEDDPELVARLMPDGYRAHGEQAVVFRVTAWDINCPQHIPQKVGLVEVEAALTEKDQRIADLEAEIALLQERARRTHQKQP
ncbi:MAG: pyridoxamine 5'-phosphate oxidase family protein, partial [Pseudomonadota bacterium]